MDAGDFETRLDENTHNLIILSCPYNQKPVDQKRSDKTGKILAHFDPDICRSCPMASRCPVKIGQRVATFTVNESEYIGATRHHKYMEDTKYRKECATRAGAEALVSELTRAHGTRCSRHRKRSLTKLQLIFAAIACNVKRFIRHGSTYAYLQPALC